MWQRRLENQYLLLRIGFEVSWAEDPTLRNLKEDGVEIEGDDGDPFKQKPEDRPNSFPAWSLDEAKEIMQAVKKYDPDNVAISEVSDEHLQKWAVLVNRSGDYKMVQDAENREEYRKEIFDAQEDLAELSNGFIEDIMVYEMRGVTKEKTNFLSLLQKEKLILSTFTIMGILKSKAWINSAA
jgi:hypothetical protein